MTWSDRWSGTHPAAQQPVTEAPAFTETVKRKKRRRPLPVLNIYHPFYYYFNLLLQPLSLQLLLWLQLQLLLLLLLQLFTTTFPIQLLLLLWLLSLWLPCYLYYILLWTSWSLLGRPAYIFPCKTPHPQQWDHSLHPPQPWQVWITACQISQLSSHHVSVSSNRNSNSELGLSLGHATFWTATW